MAVVITGNNTPTAGGVTYGDGTTYATTTAGSAGGVLYSSGSSAPAFTAAGTSGQVLQSNGSSAPSWATPSTGAMVLLQTVTASAASTADLETGIGSTYNTYVVYAEDVVPGTDTAYLQLFPKLGGTYTPSGSTGFYGNLSQNNSGSTAATIVAFSTLGASAATQITCRLNNTEAQRRCQFVLTVQGTVTSTTLGKGYTVAGSALTAVTTGTNFVGGGNFRTDNFSCAALSGLRFQMSGGTLSGTFRLYGIKNS